MRRCFPNPWNNINIPHNKITIDINQNGQFGAGDRLLLGKMKANILSSIEWDGTDASGSVVPNGSYPVKLELRIGEYHFIAEDVETSGGGSNDDGTGLDDGLTIFTDVLRTCFEVSSDTERISAE